jgi:hypothetical protein
MSNRTIAERIVNAVKSGGEAEFDHKGKRYRFDPLGLVEFLKDMGFKLVEEVEEAFEPEDKPKKRTKKAKTDEEVLNEEV